MRLIPLLLALAALPASAGDLPPNQALTFLVTTKVDVDAQGHVLSVKVPEEYPQLVRNYIERRVSHYQYQPAHQGGVPVPAITYVRVGMCVLPVTGGYQLGLDFKGNGPGVSNAGAGFLPPPVIPMRMMVKRFDGKYLVEIAVHPDGSATATNIDAEDPGTRAREVLAIRPILRHWVEGLHFQPELVNGQAVATTVQVSVVFESPRGESTSALRAESQDRALASSECQAALMPPSMVPVAQNAVVGVTPTPAS